MLRTELEILDIEWDNVTRTGKWKMALQFRKLRAIFSAIFGICN